MGRRERDHDGVFWGKAEIGKAEFWGMAPRERRPAKCLFGRFLTILQENQPNHAKWLSINYLRAKPRIPNQGQSRLIKPNQGIFRFISVSAVARTHATIHAAISRICDANLPVFRDLAIVEGLLFCCKNLNHNSLHTYDLSWRALAFVMLLVSQAAHRRCGTI